MKCAMQCVMKSVILEKISKKNHGLSEFASGPPLEGGHDANS